MPTHVEAFAFSNRGVVPLVVKAIAGDTTATVSGWIVAVALTSRSAAAADAA